MNSDPKSLPSAENVRQIRKTRVMFVLPQLDAGGSERVVFDLAKNLDPRGFDVFVAAFKGGVLEDPLRSICKRIFIIQKNKGLDVAAMLDLSRIIKQNEIGVVNAHHYMSCFYTFLGTKVLRNTALIYTEHSVPEVEQIFSSFHKGILNLMLFRMDAVVGVSNAITQRFRDKYPRHWNKFRAILNGVEVHRFRVEQEQTDVRSEVRKRWGLGSDHFVVGTVANFRRVKNHDCLVRAASRLQASHPQIRLLFAGTGFPGDSENSEPEVRHLIHELNLQGTVILAGYQENVQEILSACDAFCLPSFSEGLPISLLEAMAAGIPVVGSNVKGIAEVVTDRKTGLLFPPNDDLLLAEALQCLLDNPSLAASLAENGFRHVKERHDGTSWVQAYSQLFRSQN